MSTAFLPLTIDKSLPDGAASTKEPSRSDRKLEKALSSLQTSANRLRGGGENPAMYTSAFGLIRASISLALKAVQDPEDLDGLWQDLEKAGKALTKVETTLHRAERYR